MIKSHQQTLLRSCAVSEKNLPWNGCVIDGMRNSDFRLDSVYARSTTIAGSPLTDGFHFASTIVDDYGRPFAQGENNYAGFSLHAAAGSFAAYVDAEVQHVPFDTPPDATVQQAIAAADFTSAGALGPPSGFTRGRLLDAYVSYTFSNNQVSFGKQTLWWGPARSGATLFSNNAEPVTMLRYDRVIPLMLPGPLKLLGPMRMQFLLGRLSGAQFVQADNNIIGRPGFALGDQPFIHGGEAFPLSPRRTLSSVSRVRWIFAGEGAPFTTHTFLRSIFSVSTGNGQNDPGDRRVAVDATYRIPGLRKCLTGYVDGFSEDQPFPAHLSDGKRVDLRLLSSLRARPAPFDRPCRRSSIASSRPCLSRFLLFQRSLFERIHQQPTTHGQLDWKGG